MVGGPAGTSAGVVPVPSVVGFVIGLVRVMAGPVVGVGMSGMTTVSVSVVGTVASGRWIGGLGAGGSGAISGSGGGCL